MHLQKFISFQLEYLNVGKNELEELPEALAECTGLIKLHVFANHLRTLKPNVLGESFG